MALLSGTGIRTAEAVALQIGRLQPARPTVQLLAAAQGRTRASTAAAVLQVVDGKGNVSRTVPAGVDVVKALRHLAKVGDLQAPHTDPAIPALAGGPGDARIAQPVVPTTTRTLHRIGEVIGLPPGLARPHALRHAYAYAQLDPTQRPDGRPIPLGVLQRRLGHTDVATTARYLRAGQDPDLP